MTAEGCAELVRRGDPGRFRTVLVAPPEKRPGLMALYAFNLEIARTPWLSAEPMIVQIRLRWWLDALAEIAAGDPPRRHEVVVPLAATIRQSDLPISLLESAIEARLQDADPAPFADIAALTTYVRVTYGAIMELAAWHLDAPADALPVVRRFAEGAGIAALLRAVPTLKARGRNPLGAGTDVADLARTARIALAEARAERHRVPRVGLAALLPGAEAGFILRRAEARPALDVSLDPPEGYVRAAVLMRAFSGRW